jgi:hypothetical protein
MRDDTRGETSMRGEESEVTIVLTTSPCRSHPSTVLIEETVASIARHAGASPSTGTRLLVVCDGVKLRAKSKFRSGQVDEDGAARYEAYLDRLSWLVRDGTSPLRGAEILRLEERHGFGHALKRGMMRVTTPYVLVCQHDRVFTRDVPMRAVLDIMETDESVAYCGFPTSTTLAHDKSHQSRFPGYSAFHLPRRTYDQHPGLELVPLTQFYDSIHVARTSWFLSSVYGLKRWTNLPLGGFIEDTFGQVMLDDIRRHGPSAHAKYRTFIVEDDIGTPMAGHIDGHDPIDPHSPAFARRFSRASAHSTEADWRARGPAVVGAARLLERLPSFGHFTERARYLRSIHREDLLPPHLAS